MIARDFNERDIHLALDGELPEDDRAAYEAWLSAHPDMKARSGVGCRKRAGSGQARAYSRDWGGSARESGDTKPLVDGGSGFHADCRRPG